MSQAIERGVRSAGARPRLTPVVTRGRLTTMSLGEPLELAIARRLEALAQLPYVDQVLALPDVHQKDRMEIPSSIAIATRDVVVPEFTSVAVNDGMGVVTTTLREEDVTGDKLEAFFRGVNAHAAAHFFDRNRYSLPADALAGALLDGAGGVLERYGFDARILDRIERRGCIPVSDRGVLRQAVPAHLLASRFSRCEMGLNFGGNHFLEVQVVDRVADADTARAWGLEAGQVIVMYHLGPGPFSGTLLHHYARRTKLRRERVPLFLLSKLAFHFVQRAARGSAARKWALHFRRNGWTPFPQASEEGRLLRDAIAMGTNYGWAYRLATVRAIMDGLREHVSPRVGLELFCDVSHNGIQREALPDGDAWVARHNACRLEPGAPAIVAGAHDVPSYLGIGGDGQEGRLHSYDHGAGHLIDLYRSQGRLHVAAGTVHRFRMTRGRRAEMTSRRALPMRSAEPVERLMECLEAGRVMRPVVRLRPLGNFKNG